MPPWSSVPGPPSSAAAPAARDTCAPAYTVPGRRFRRSRRTPSPPFPMYRLYPAAVRRCTVLSSPRSTGRRPPPPYCPVGATAASACRTPAAPSLPPRPRRTASTGRFPRRPRRRYTACRPAPGIRTPAYFRQRRTPRRSPDSTPHRPPRPRSSPHPSARRCTAPSRSGARRPLPDRCAPCSSP